MSKLAAAASANFDLRASPLLSIISCLFIAGKALAVSSRGAAKGPSVDLLLSAEDSDPLRLSFLCDLGKATPLRLLSLESWLEMLV